MQKQKTVQPFEYESLSTKTFSQNELAKLICANTHEIDPNLQTQALTVRQRYYGNTVFFRGLIEFTNYCKNDCYYCGLRSKNTSVKRYRLDKQTILDCCKTGYELGFRTFVLQGGEDPYFTVEKMIDIVSSIREKYSDCAITLSYGEHSKQTYQELFKAGANRYLLRHETATQEHYNLLHPDSLSLAQRKRCLFDLKEIGFQVGAGFMVGSPFQTDEHLANDLIFLKQLQPDMVGVGPFIPHAKSVFANHPSGSVTKTLAMLALTRLVLPKALLPATTALGTLESSARERGFSFGANVVMPNLSPKDVREDYMLYDNKIHSKEESAQAVASLVARVQSAGFVADFSRGDVAKKTF